MIDKLVREKLTRASTVYRPPVLDVTQPKAFTLVLYNRITYFWTRPDHYPS